MSIRHRLEELGLVLPENIVPRGEYEPVVILNGLAYVSGQVCRINDGVIKGPLTDQTPEEVLALAGRACVLRALSLLERYIGLEQVQQIVFLRGFVYGTAGGLNYSAAVDGASRLLLDIFGDRGRHARSAIGVAGLPSDGLLEVEIVAAIAKA